MQRWQFLTTGWFGLLLVALLLPGGLLLLAWTVVRQLRRYLRKPD